jgi:hypothetical protein
MSDLPDEVQREFEARPGGSRLISICVIRKHLIQSMHPQQENRLVYRILTAIVYWLRSFDAKPGEAKCLGCGATLMLPGVQSEAYAVGFPTAKLRNRGRGAALVGSFCAKCSAQTDDELNELARKRWAPTSTPLQGALPKTAGYRT